MTREALRAAWPQMVCPRCQGPFDPLDGLVGAKGGTHANGSTPGATASPPDPPAKARGPVLTWLFGGLSLLLLLVAQSAWWARGALIQSPIARPFLEGLCQPLGCRVPLPRLPSELVVTERQLEPHPEQAGRWRLQLGLRNQATVPQALPVIEVELYDLRERLTAVGRFRPEQYSVPGLPQAIAPQGVVKLRLEMGAPDPEPSGFRLRLL